MLGSERVGHYRLGKQVQVESIWVKWVDMREVEMIGKRVMDFGKRVRVLGNLG